MKIIDIDPIDIETHRSHTHRTRIGANPANAGVGSVAYNILRSQITHIVA